MLILIVLWWVCLQLAAPTWVFVALGVAIFAKLIDGISDAFRALVELADFKKKK